MHPTRHNQTDDRLLSTDNWPAGPTAVKLCPCAAQPHLAANKLKADG